MQLQVSTEDPPAYPVLARIKTLYNHRDPVDLWVFAQEKAHWFHEDCVLLEIKNVHGKGSIATEEELQSEKEDKGKGKANSKRGRLLIRRTTLRVCSTLPLPLDEAN